MITIGFADLLAGLYAGKIKDHGRLELQSYFSHFMDRAQYPSDGLDVLYEGLRHKIAHLGHPLVVFDTATKPKVFTGPRRRYGWTVYASERSSPIELVHYSAPKLATKHTPPWDVSYDSRIKVSVSSLSKDLIASVFKHDGYYSRLESDPAALSAFMKCMEEFYPR